jgi:large subunit ribosomal protein L10
MNRTRKQEVVVDFKDMFSQANATFVVEYKSIDVVAMQRLRKELRAQNASLKVTKARLMKKALESISGTEELLGDLKQQVALVFAQDEVPATAKTLVAFAKEKNELKIVSGFFEQKRMDVSRIAFLAALPSREGIMAQIAGTLNEMIARIPRAIQMANEKRMASEGAVEAVQIAE